MIRNLAVRTIVAAALLSAKPAFARQTPTQVLGYFIGNWVGKTKYESGAKPLDGPIGTTMAVTRAVGGKYIQVETVILIPGSAEETMMMLTFDPPKGLYEGWTFNAHSAGAHMTTAIPGPDPNTIELSSPGVVANGENTAYRMRFHIDKRDQFTLTYETRHYDPTIKRDNKDIWSPVYTSVYTRAPSN